jgi:DMSO reductase anchor subunit
LDGFVPDGLHRLLIDALKGVNYHEAEDFVVFSPNPIKGIKDIMLQTLPLVLFVVMAEVSIGAVSVLVFLDWRNEVKRGFLVSYALIYLVLAGLTYWFQQSFATPALLNTFPWLDKTWTVQLSLPLLLFFLLLIPYSFFLLLDKKAGVQEESTSSRSSGSTLRVLRLLSGVLTVIVGLITLFVIAMIFRPLAPNTVAGYFTVAGFFASAFALGGVMTAMWLGHWYLVTPALSEKPLQFSTTLVLVAITAQVIFFLITGSHSTYANKVPTHTSTAPAVTATATPASSSTGSVKPANVPVVTPLSTAAISWIHILVGFAMPLILGALSWKLIRDRSFQSATGMLYLVVVCTLAGEIIARGLFLGGLA